MQAAGMRNVRIFASGTNLLTWAASKNITELEISNIWY